MHNIDDIVSLKLNVQSDLMLCSFLLFSHNVCPLPFVSANLDANMKNTPKIHAVVKAPTPTYLQSLHLLK